MLPRGMEACMLFRSIIPALIAASLAACETSVGVAYPTTPTPDLVAISPGVSVIADYEEPIFYTGGFYYWRLGGAWYRSPNYTTGWAYWPRAPYGIVQIRVPYRYKYYRPYGYVAYQRPVPAYRIERPYVRQRRVYYR